MQVAIEGILRDQTTGAGLHGLRVELWEASDEALAPLAQSESDEAGGFALDLPAAVGGRGADLEIRVIEEGQLVHSELRPRDANGQGNPLELRVQRGSAEAEPDEIANPSLVRGRVRGSVPDGTNVRAVLRTLSEGKIEERVVGEAGVHAFGWYRLSYERPTDEATLARTSLVTQLIASDGAVIAESAPLLGPQRRARLDLRPRWRAESSEYALLERHIGSQLGGAEALDGLQDEAIGEVADWLQIEPRRVALLRQSRALAAETGLPGELFYALGHNGPPALAEIADAPIHELRTAVEEAVSSRIVGAGLLEDLDPMLGQLAERAVESAMEADGGSMRSGLAEVLASAGLPHDTIRTVLRRSQRRIGDETLGESLSGGGEGEGEALGEDVRNEVELAVEVGGIVGADGPLLRRLHGLRREGRWRNAEDLAGFDFEAWCEMIEGAAGEGGGARVEARANAIVDTLEERYPSAVIRRTMIAAGEVSEGARRVLDRAPDHDLVKHSIRARATANAALLEGFAGAEGEEALEEIASIERIARVTPRAEHVTLLVATGMRSAQAIAATPRRHFIDVYGEALDGRDQAAAVHAQAQQVSAATLLSLTRLLQSLQHQPRVLGGSAVKQTPELSELFGAMSSCACENCSSVYSPAAYYVDLLRYLDLKNEGRIKEVMDRLDRLRDRGRPSPPDTATKLRAQRPLEHLFERRPDLEDIELTCENTFTTLPYIDLVNELLEARVVGTKTVARQTGKVTADVLKAVPQNIDPEAYGHLQQAVYPTTLPFHEPLAVARAYLGHLGVKRAELVKELARGDNREPMLVAEELGMSGEEIFRVARPPQEPWRHFGFDAERVGWREAVGIAKAKLDDLLGKAPSNTPWVAFGLAAEEVTWVEALVRVPSFMRRAGVSFQELIDLAGMRFINGDGAMRLDAAARDCDPDSVRIAGLDANRLSRVLQILRLKRRLKWSFADIDRALSAFGAAEIDLAVLRKLVDARDLARRLDRPIEDLFGLWAPLDTLGSERVLAKPSDEGWAGEGSVFRRLLQTRAVAWHTHAEVPFQLRPDRSELKATGDSLDPIAPALLAAFRITNEDLSTARAIHAWRGLTLRLDLAGLSAVYRVAFLARALHLRIEQLGALLRLVPPDADPFMAASPASTRRFVDIADEVAESEFTAERLLYLFRARVLPRRDPSPTAAQVEAVLTSLRRGLADAFTETAAPAELNADSLRGKLAIWLDGALLDQAMLVLDPRTPATPEQRRDFFGRHLARIFPDATAAVAQLFGPEGAPAPAVPSPIAASSAPPRPREDTPAAAPVAAPAAATPGSTAPSPPDPALEQRFRANLQLVLANLLPQLRARQIRGAVVQALGDVLGTSAASTGHLLETAMRSRRKPGEPLIQDFYALLGTGLTGAYFAGAGLGGQPAVTRTDPKLDFAWAGGPPAEGVPGQGFSVRWTGRLLPRAKAQHTFFVSTDGAVRIAIKVGGVERVLLEKDAGKGRVVEHVSQPIALDPSALSEIRIEYENHGTPASFSVQLGTSPSSKQSIPTPQLYPSDGLSSFEPVAQAYRRLHKAAMLITGFGISDAHLEWLTGDPRYLDLDALPMDPDGGGDGAVASFQRWRQLAALYALRKRLPRSNTDLFQAMREGTLPQAVDTLAAATGWDKSVIGAFVGTDGFAVGLDDLRLPVDPAREAFLIRLDRAVGLQRRMGVAPATAVAWASSTPDTAVSEAIVQVVKARYDEKRWLEVAQSLNDPLRIERRDALVAYLLPRMRKDGIESRSQLFEYFLIDVEMSPCMLTSRIKQAISAVQTFFQRCLMNLEHGVSPRVIDEDDWKWIKNYRVWEANRKVFLYPENWIEPELRDDKSPIFKDLERAILQQEITHENVESAFIDYLQDLDEVARLDVRAVWFEPRELHPAPPRPGEPELPPPPAPLPLTAWDGVGYRSQWDAGTYHVFARTYDTPSVWFHRRLERGRVWTPWEKIEADIEGDHLVPVVYQRRMYLFWTILREMSKPAPEPEKDAVPYKLGKDYEITVAYSVYDRGKWSRKRMSGTTVTDALLFNFTQAYKVDFARRQQQNQKQVAPKIEGSAWLPKSAYTLRATVSDEQDELQVYLYRRTIDQLRVSMTPTIPKDAEEVLSPDSVDLVATFRLDGSNGELDVRYASASALVMSVQAQHRRVQQLLGGRRSRGARSAAPVQTFDQAIGGRLDLPPGYRVDATGFGSGRSGASTLSLWADRGPGLGRLLGRVRTSGVRLLPVVNPAAPPDGGIFPFFFQDRRRTFFVRPVAKRIGPRWIRFARPIFNPQPAQPTAPPQPVAPLQHAAPPRPQPATRRRRSGHREEIETVLSEATSALISAEIDDLADAAWHPDDAAPRAPRRRGGLVRPPPAVEPHPAVQPPPPQMQVVQVQQPTHFEWRLRFVPFEHPKTSRLIRELKGGGVERLLDLTTTRPNVGTPDHDLRDGKWAQRDSGSFAQTYEPGPLTDDLHPHLDVDFDADNPYALYNWELFFHAPLAVAARLAKDGRHDEAQHWFHFIFDPTSDTARKGSMRYWNFAPFLENAEYDGARELMALLTYEGDDPKVVDRQYKVRDQVAAWQEKPFSPHVIARLRIAAYQKAVVMKYIDNLIEWGDKLFRQDTMESIQEATQLYILAGNILGPRPERVPPMVKAPPATFRQVRERLRLFADWSVKFENDQVRPPFRINVTPDVGAATSVLGMATLYFCVPPNPQLDKYWDTVDDRLFKIRNCMNIKGVVRSLALFEPPIDPGMLVRAAAAGADLGSVIANLNAPPPHHRFRVHLARAVTLAEEVRRFGEATLRVLEKRDAEGLAALKASHETALNEAVRDISKTRIKQVEEELSALALERDGVDLQIQYVVAQAAMLMNPQEAAKQQELTASQVLGDVMDGISLVAKVMHAIPQFQTGAAGGFSSPFVTLELGGRMFGEITMAAAQSVGAIKARHDTSAAMAETQAEYQRRQEEYAQEAEVLQKEKERLTAQIAEINTKLEIHNAELRRHDTAVENARAVETYLREKYTSQELYGWMLGEISGLYFQAYKLAFDCAKLAERAMRFERGDAAAQYVKFSYWDSLKKGLYAGESLLVDLRRMEAAYLEGDERALEITRHVSLRDDAPTALEELLATGRCKLEVTETLLDGDFPGHYFRRIKSVSLSARGTFQAQANVNCTLTLLDNRIRTGANASGSYPQAEDGDDPRFLSNATPVQAIATSRPTADAGMFELRFDDDRYLPFEGAGAISSWRIDLHQADNAVDLAEITDVVLSLSYSARSGGAPLEAAARQNREKLLARGGLQPPPQQRVSLRHDLPEIWKRLGEAPQGQDVEAALPLLAERFSARYRGLVLRLEGLTAYAHARADVQRDTLRLKIDPPKGSGVQAAGWTPPWPASRTLRARPEVSGGVGAWKLAIGAQGAHVPDLFDDVVLVFDLGARAT